MERLSTHTKRKCKWIHRNINTHTTHAKEKKATTETKTEQVNKQKNKYEDETIKIPRKAYKIFKANGKVMIINGAT